MSDNSVRMNWYLLSHYTLGFSVRCQNLSNLILLSIFSFPVFPFSCGYGYRNMICIENQNYSFSKFIYIWMAILQNFDKPRQTMLVYQTDALFCPDFFYVVSRKLELTSRFGHHCPLSSLFPDPCRTTSCK